MTVPRLGIVGTGSVARAVGRRHADAGGRVAFVRSRDTERASGLAERLDAAPVSGDDRLPDADVVLVAVADRAVHEVGIALAALLPADTPVLHTSGALPASELGPGLSTTGSLHPLQSLPAEAEADSAADGRLAARLEGCHWFHEGGGRALAAALVELWGGSFRALAPGAKVLYHAAAAMVSNHGVALFDAATQVMAAAGIAEPEARAPLVELLRGTTANLAVKGAPGALTGPVARGDVRTVERHLDALRRGAPHLVPSYVALALLAVDVAVRRGSVDALTAARLRRVLTPGG